MRFCDIALFVLYYFFSYNYYPYLISSSLKIYKD
ncbi:hypothetical protein QEG_2207, partial [Clostridioides difficile CD127]